MLDGRGSQDPDGNALDFFWEVLEPTDDSVQLIGWDQPNPTITGSPNFSGRSIVQLKVVMESNIFPRSRLDPFFCRSGDAGRERW